MVTFTLPSGEQRTSTGDTITIGASPSCQICIPDPRVRAHHAAVRKVAGKWIIEAIGDWTIKIDDGVGARKCWLTEGCEVHLTEDGPTVVFEVGTARQPAAVQSITPQVQLNQVGAHPQFGGQQQADHTQPLTPPTIIIAQGGGANEVLVWGLVGGLVLLVIAAVAFVFMYISDEQREFLAKRDQARNPPNNPADREPAAGRKARAPQPVEPPKVRTRPLTDSIENSPEAQPRDRAINNDPNSKPSTSVAATLGTSISKGNNSKAAGAAGANQPTRSDYDYDFSKDDTSIPDGAKSQPRTATGSIPKDGYAIRDENGYVDSSGKFVSHGVTTLWGDPQRTVKREESPWFHGKMHGTYYSWHTSGKKSLETQLVNGKRHGIERQWTETGSPLIVRHYINGNGHGTYTEWYSKNSNQKFCEYNEISGKINGTATWWFENGKVKQTALFSEGNMVSAKLWRLDGRPLREEHFDDDKRHGEYRAWDPAGRIAWEGKYSHGRPAGQWRVQIYQYQNRITWTCALIHGELIDPDFIEPLQVINVNMDSGSGGSRAAFLVKLYAFSENHDLGIRYHADTGRMSSFTVLRSDVFHTQFGKSSSNVSQIGIESEPRSRRLSFRCTDGIISVNANFSEDLSIVQINDAK